MSSISLFLPVALVAAIALSSCTTSQEKPEHRLPSSPAPASAAGDWGFLKFAEVRAYRMNWNEEDSFDCLVDRNGKLNPTRRPKEGIKLNLDQVTRLRLAVTGKHPRPLGPSVACFYPHHAFAFYDEKGQRVGDIDICFLCGNYGGQPEGFADTWDLKSIATILKDLDIPLYNPRWD